MKTQEEILVCRKCGKSKLRKYFKPLITVKSKACWCRMCCAEASLVVNRRLKQEVFAAYGTACAICSETDIDVLTLDHKDQEGSEHRKQNSIGTGSETWRWARKNNYPLEFRVLCFNCNTKEYRKFLRAKREIQMIKEAITVAEKF
jgi:hypothetical protein